MSTHYEHPTAVTVDIDSTLADTQHRQHLIDPAHRDATDWLAYARACAGDTPTSVITLVALLAASHNIVLITSRPEPARAETIAWLDAHGVIYDALVMDDGDYPSTTAFKVAAVEQVDAVYPVLLHLDDWWENNQAITATLGIPAVTVNVYAPAPVAA